MWRYLLTAILCVTVPAQAQTVPANKDQAMQDAAKQGFPIQPEFPVEVSNPFAGRVSIEAVLLPPTITAGLFGKAVAQRYVAMEVIVSNRSLENALIVHDIFIDYSRWLLSGSGGGIALQACAETSDKTSGLPCRNATEVWQSQNKANQIASAEYRLPRGTLLDSQPFTVRNLTIHSLEAAGTIASGYGFAFHELGIAKGISSYNGSFLPAARYIWPDRTLEQANRISDFGFRVNRVVAENNSEMMVAFFPIDRFIAPGLKKIFLKSPALFFSPLSYVTDKRTKKEVEAILKDLLPDGIPNWGEQLRTLLKSTQPTPELQLLSGLSLNSVRVFVSGSLVAKAEPGPPHIDSVELEGDTAKAIFGAPGEKTGSIHGHDLQDGTPVILNAENLGVSKVSVIKDGSTDAVLRFKVTFSKPIDRGQFLVFQVNRLDKDGKILSGGNRYPLQAIYLP